MRTRWIALAALLPACGGNNIDDGRALFAAGAYAEAQQKLNRVGDGEYRDLDVRTKAVYCLYRGLTFGALGDRPNAVAWLGLAQQTEEDHPGSLNSDDVARLKRADRKYGPLPRTSEPPEK